MTDPTMRERVATAIGNCGDSLDWDICLEYACAAIAAMREPTAAMWDGAKPHMDSWSSNAAWWQAMIDAALADETMTEPTIAANATGA